MNPSQPRRGYALVVVILFLTLFMGLWGVAARQVGTMLRIEQARSKRARREADSLDAMKALAQGLAALEVGFPRLTPNPAGPPSMWCVVRASDPNYTLTFTMDGASGTLSSWTVQVSPTSSSPPPFDPDHPTLDTQQFISQHQ